MHIENISLITSTIDDYAIYSRDTLTTLKNVTIKGYSGLSGETGGGAMRIRDADYSSESPPHSANNPTISNVTIENCCRGIRIQDSNNAYITDCSVLSVTDNAYYFAARTYTSGTGCINCTFNNCTSIIAGQCSFINIGGDNNKFTNCDMNGSRGAAVGVYNTNGTIEVNNCNFVNANTQETTTLWGGNTDEFGGAAAGLSVESSDVSASLIIQYCTFTSGEGSVFWKTEPGEMNCLNNQIVVSNFPAGVIANDSSFITIL